MITLFPEDRKLVGGNKFGDRQGDTKTVHAINILTVVANESYKDFVAETKGSLSSLELREVKKSKYPEPENSLTGLIRM